MHKYIEDTLIFSAIYTKGMLNGVVFEYNSYNNRSKFTDYVNNIKHGNCVTRIGSKIEKQEVYKNGFSQRDLDMYSFELDTDGCIIKESVYMDK